MSKARIERLIKQSVIHASSETAGIQTMTELLDPDMKRYRIYFHELMQKYKHYLNADRNELPASVKDVIGTLQSGWTNGDEWYGTDAETILARHANGYRLGDADETFEVPVPILTTARSSWKPSDVEGEPDLLDALQGEVEWMREWRPVQKPGGLRLRVLNSFSSGNDHNDISLYGAWVGYVIDALQTSGFDVEVTATEPSRDCYGDQWRSKNVIVDVILSQIGQQVFSREWGVMFSPGAYRHLHFTGLIAPGEDKNMFVYSSLGHTFVKGHGVAYTPHDKTITVFPPYTCYDGFPIESLNECFEKVMHDARLA